MEILKFNLKGSHAFFKVPEVNTYYYFTYGNIHKVALLGMLGAIMGYKGYQMEDQDYPEFYEKLQYLNVSIVPEQKQGYFQKKIQVFNNSVGYASKEAGGNLIVKEQWLENPEWTIYIQIKDEESRELAERIMARKCTYMPYLGKNDHMADISGMCIVSGEERFPKNETADSLVPEGAVQFDWDDMTYRYEEYLPVGLKESTNLYRTHRFIFTDAEMDQCMQPVYKVEGRNLLFF